MIKKIFKINNGIPERSEEMQPNISTNITNTYSNSPPKCDQIFTECPTWVIQDFDLDMFFLIKK